MGTRNEHKWQRDGDQWVATINGKEARITEWFLTGQGAMFSIMLDGCPIVGKGESATVSRADALVAAKAHAEQQARLAP